jgi:glycyl-tRNA synthetase beta chain
VPDLLLELFSEEIPARMQADAAAQLHQRFAAMLELAGLTAETVRADATPRRLLLLARGLPAASAATSEERRGPRADAPEAAIAGFLKSTGLARDALEERETEKGRFLFAVIDRPGRPTVEVLGQHLPAVIEGLAWPKSMRWGAASASTASPRWVRPLRAIVALLDAEVVPFAELGLASGRTTFGHRFHAPGMIELRSAASHDEQLRAARVIVSGDERAAIIRDRAARAAADAGLVLVEDEALVAENAGLTEWPVPLLGRFDPAFLDVPAEIIALTMKANQKYFACRHPDGALAPAFVCVANIEAPDGGRTIVAGNERVLAARLADARFFWEQDRQVPLEEQAQKLAGITFHAKLGSIADKVERVAKLAR